MVLNDQSAPWTVEGGSNRSNSRGHLKIECACACVSVESESHPSCIGTSPLPTRPPTPHRQTPPHSRVRISLYKKNAPRTRFYTTHVQRLAANDLLSLSLAAIAFAVTRFTIIIEAIGRPADRHTTYKKKNNNNNNKEPRKTKTTDDVANQRLEFQSIGLCRLAGLRWIFIGRNFFSACCCRTSWVIAVETIKEIRQVRTFFGSFLPTPFPYAL